MEPQARYQSVASPADATIHGCIRMVRDQKVMLDRDLAELYGVEVKRLKEQVRRNRQRFPKDFMLELTPHEAENSRSQFVTLNQGDVSNQSDDQGVLRSQIATLKQGEHSKHAPFAFTEHGILMLANVLRSERAIVMSIHIIRVFTRMREVILSSREVLQKLEQLEERVGGHDEGIQALFDHITAMVSSGEQSRRAIGFEPNDA